MVIAISPVYQTKSWGFEGPDFLNAVIQIRTILSSSKVLKNCLKIEQNLGRKQPLATGVYQDRPIDIDLLFYGNEIIHNKILTVPHPELQNRNFVLHPLHDIAPELVHPILLTPVKELLGSSPDQDYPTRITKMLKNPIDNYSLNKYNYIAIEGNIGAGKTTLTTKIAQDFNAKLILERFKDNPFLPKFYKEPERYAFPLEMSFLADRYQQLLDDIGQYDLFKDFMIADYDCYKSLIFSKVTLAEEEYGLYKKLHGIMYRDVPKPNLYVYLYQNTERLLANIKKRGRAYEQEISEEYLSKINQGYLDYIKNQPHLNVKIIDISHLDFVKNREDYLFVLREMLAQ